MSPDRAKVTVALRRAFWTATAIGALGLVSVAAILGAGEPARAASAPSVYAEYHPGLADMMTMAVQPRHTKLGLAIRARNWTYAVYEVGELRGAFARIVRSIPSYEGKDTAELVVMIAKPIETLQAAGRAKDAVKADAAYAEVTQTCNMCHQAQGRDYIVMRAPAAAMFPDQDFSPRP
jgi:hypothetical protein